METTYPRTVAALVESPWYQKIKTLVVNFKLNEPVEDTVNDILLDMMQKKYLERWDPKSGSYSNWLYTFASNICRKKYNRSNTRGGKAIEGAASITYTSSSDDLVPGLFYEETLQVEDSEPEVTFDFPALCAEIDSILSKYPAHSTNEFNGKVYQRDMLTVFHLLKQEFTPKEIAECFNTSIEFIYILIRRMRKLLLSESKAVFELYINQ